MGLLELCADMTDKIEVHCPTHGVLFEPRCAYCQTYARGKEVRGDWWTVGELEALIESASAAPVEVSMPEHEHDWARKGGVPQFCLVCATPAPEETSR
jgi:Zn-finger nucleic acid-binding protein